MSAEKQDIYEAFVKSATIKAELTEICRREAQAEWSVPHWEALMRVVNQMTQLLLTDGENRGAWAEISEAARLGEGPEVSLGA